MNVTISISISISISVQLLGKVDAREHSFSLHFNEQAISMVASFIRSAALLRYKRRIEQRDDIISLFQGSFEGCEEFESAPTRDIVEK
jgi:hypothetical protein